MSPVRTEADFRLTDDEITWHGWGVHGTSLHVGPLPGRKSIALYSDTGCEVFVMAYFRSQEEARRALGILDTIALGQVKHSA